MGAFDENEFENLKHIRQDKEFDLKVVDRHIQSAEKCFGGLLHGEEPAQPVQQPPQQNRSPLCNCCIAADNSDTDARTPRSPEPTQPSVQDTESRQPSPAQSSSDPAHSFRQATQYFKQAVILDSDNFNREEFEGNIKDVERCVNEANYSSSEDIRCSTKELCDAISHFQKTLLNVLEVPPMYLNTDRANALTAALLYQKINTFQPPQHPTPGQSNPPEARAEYTQSPDNEQDQPADSTRPLCQQPHPEDNARYTLLLFLIREEF